MLNYIRNDEMLYEITTKNNISDAKMDNKDWLICLMAYQLLVDYLI